MLDRYSRTFCFLLIATLLFFIYNCKSTKNDIKPITYNNQKGLVCKSADPFVLEYDGSYYMYTTSDSASNAGIPVYKSDDLVNWSKAVGVNDGLALIPEDVWGTKWFWSGDVIEKDGKFYIFYTANEHLGVAISNSPLGPFKQDVKRAFHENINEIDASVFIDDDGKAYIYFVRFNKGNEIFVAELSKDLLSMKEETIRLCFRPEQEWEFGKNKPQAEVNEGAFMIKHKGLYYLTYTANHFASIDYSVGYAISKTPTGPWKKYENNPILKRTKYIYGPGNGMVVNSPDKKEKLFVYHTHKDTLNISPRKIAMDRIKFVSDKNGGPDILVIDGPSFTDIEINNK